MEDVDVIESEPPQGRLHLGRDRGGGVARAEQRLGRDDQAVATAGPRGGADDLLGAVRFGRVEEVDAEIDRRTDHRDAVVEAGAAPKAQPAVAAAAEPGDADRQSGLPERPVFHRSPFHPSETRRRALLPGGA